MIEVASRRLGCLALGMPPVCLFVLLQLRADLNLYSREKWLAPFGAALLSGLMLRYILARKAAGLSFIVVLFLPLVFLFDFETPSLLVLFAHLTSFIGFLALSFVGIPYYVIRASELFGDAIPVSRLLQASWRKALLVLGMLLYGLAWTALGKFLLPESSIGSHHLAFVPESESGGLGWGVYLIPILVILVFIVVEGLCRDQTWAVVCSGPLLALIDVVSARSLVVPTLLIFLLAFLPALPMALKGPGMRYGWLVGSWLIATIAVVLELQSGMDSFVQYSLSTTLLIAALSSLSYSELALRPYSWKRLVGETLKALSPGHWFLGTAAKVRWLDGAGPKFE